MDCRVDLICAAEHDLGDIVAYIAEQAVRVYLIADGRRSLQRLLERRLLLA